MGRTTIDRPADWHRHFWLVTPPQRAGSWQPGVTYPARRCRLCGVRQAKVAGRWVRL